MSYDKAKARIAALQYFRSRSMSGVRISDCFYVIYSYRHPIAIHVQSEGVKIWLVSDYHYSRTTSKHIRVVEEVIYGNYGKLMNYTYALTSTKGEMIEYCVNAALALRKVNKSQLLADSIVSIIKEGLRLGCYEPKR